MWTLDSHFFRQDESPGQFWCIIPCAQFITYMSLSDITSGPRTLLQACLCPIQFNHDIFSSFWHQWAHDTQFHCILSEITIFFFFFPICYVRLGCVSHKNCVGKRHNIHVIVSVQICHNRWFVIPSFNWTLSTVWQWTVSNCTMI